MYKCGVCQLYFINLSDLTGHGCVNDKQESRPHSHNECDHTYSQQTEETKTHTCQKQRGEVSVVDTGEIPVDTHNTLHNKGHKCNVCDKMCGVSYRIDIRTSVPKDTGKDDYKCDVCDDMFADYSKFKEHRKTHVDKNGLKISNKGSNDVILVLTRTHTNRNVPDKVNNIGSSEPTEGLARTRSEKNVPGSINNLGSADLTYELSKTHVDHSVNVSCDTNKGFSGSTHEFTQTQAERNVNVPDITNKGHCGETQLKYKHIPGEDPEADCKSGITDDDVGVSSVHSETEEDVDVDVHDVLEVRTVRHKDDVIVADMKKLSSGNKEKLQNPAANSQGGTETTQKMYRCGLCSKEFQEVNQIREHQRIHWEIKKPQVYFCKSCGKEYKSAKTLKIHHRIIHKGWRPRPLREKPDKHLCQYCGDKFQLVSTFRKHIKMHLDDEKPHKCEICGKQFRSINGLRFHRKIHTGGKTPNNSLRKSRNRKCKTAVNHSKPQDKAYFSCDVCKQEFSTEFRLKVHAKIHGSQKPYKCDVCGYQCKLARSLKNHMKKHAEDTQGKPYKCKICDYQCRSASSMSVHTKTHEQPKSETDGERDAANNPSPKTKTNKQPNLQTDDEGDAANSLSPETKTNRQPNSQIDNKEEFIRAKNLCPKTKTHEQLKSQTDTEGDAANSLSQKTKTDRQPKSQNDNKEDGANNTCPKTKTHKKQRKSRKDSKPKSDHANDLGQKAKTHKQHKKSQNLIMQTI
ncbi:zinc finger protein 624-like [Argopecten irradians]|uniref:zinc finger protein 624-like n=1 Tax=Argopecten irradians TaxID=31199 RepID=UPI0037240CCC